MQKIKLRTKTEFVILLFFLIILSIVSVVSINRTISDSGDNIVTFIRNTKGNIWECTGANLQTAIDNLSGYGGTIWVGSDITLSSEILIQNSIDNIVIDFQGNDVTLSGSSVGFINLTNTSYVTVKNLQIKPHEDSTASLIKLYIHSTGDSTSYNTFSHIAVLNQGTYSSGYLDHNFTVIEMTLYGAGEINQNTFCRIVANGVGKGMYLNQLVNTGWINGTYVDDLYLNQHIECIRFSNYPGNNRSFNFNRFCNIKTQASTFTEYGITNISGFGNHFDHCLIWDWYICNNPVYEYHISADADSTYMQLSHWEGISSGYCVNNGINTMVITDGKIAIGG
jgi:hypothetical protein